MIGLRRPTDAEIRSRLDADGAQLTYPEVGASKALDPPPASLAARYDVDHHAFDLGRGPAVFERARDSLLAWRHFEIPWIELHGAADPAREGQVVATLVRLAGLWFFNPCRVVYVAASETHAEFAYGTLEGHAERGEERFRVGLDPATEHVTYEINVFSRPALLFTRLGKPLARRVQRRFVRASARALARAAQ